MIAYVVNFSRVETDSLDLDARLQVCILANLARRLNVKMDSLSFERFH